MPIYGISGIEQTRPVRYVPAMLMSNNLRIDRGDGFPIVDYRIENGVVETRTVEDRRFDSESEWKLVTADQLSAHVIANTAVAQWLCRRMGPHRLVRACNQNMPVVDETALENQENKIAA